jgi:hypothetical protein
MVMKIKIKISKYSALVLHFFLHVDLFGGVWGSTTGPGIV